MTPEDVHRRASLMVEGAAKSIQDAAEWGASATVGAAHVVALAEMVRDLAALMTAKPAASVGVVRERVMVEAFGGGGGGDTTRSYGPPQARCYDCWKPKHEGECR